VKIGTFPENLVERLAPALEPDLALHLARKPGWTDLRLVRMSGAYDA
jgi:hypothetical protein